MLKWIPVNRPTSWQWLKVWCPWALPCKKCSWSPFYNFWLGFFCFLVLGITYLVHYMTAVVAESMSESLSFLLFSKRKWWAIRTMCKGLLDSRMWVWSQKWHFLLVRHRLFEVFTNQCAEFYQSFFLMLLIFFHALKNRIMLSFKWHLAVNETYFAFILTRNLYINLRGWCQIMSWERGWWGTGSTTLKSITAWNRREKHTSSLWTICSECKVHDPKKNSVRSVTLHSFH